MSVITNLIGTPFLKPCQEPWILFLEDIDESAPKLMRYLNQWLQSDHLQHCQAIILGEFQKLSIAPNRANMLELADQFAKRTKLPILYCPSFGHIEDNWPIGIGAQGTLSENSFSWEIKNVRTNPNFST